MNGVFRHLLRKFILVFFDDIFVYCPDWETHLSHLRQVIQVLKDNCLYLKCSKCEIATQTVSYLGHTISSDGVSVDPSKIDAIVDWPKPATVKALREFLGLAGFYRRFVKGYAGVAAPLTSLLCKDAFWWTTTADEAFASLKTMLTTTPLLRLPNFSIPFTIKTDASGTAMGAVLQQEGRPIAFFSRTFPPGNQAELHI